MNILKVTMTCDNAVLPVRGSKDAAGWDLHAAESCSLKPGERRVISSGIAAEIPGGYFGSIRPRSGLAVKHGIDTMAGVIDSDYRGEIGVVLINHGDSDFSIVIGDRIAQMIIQRHHTGDMPLMAVNELDDSRRGDKGFGSTGT